MWAGYDVCSLQYAHIMACLFTCNTSAFDEKYGFFCPFIPFILLVSFYSSASAVFATACIERKKQ